VLFEASPDNYLLRLDGTARYWARAGREVLIDIAPKALEVRVRTHFLGAVLTALLHQRGVLVMHASCVLGSRGAVLLAGHSGHGKSTLAAALASRGYRAAGDDAAVVTADRDDRLIVQPGFPQVRLWADAVSRLGHSPEQVRRVDPDKAKYALELGESHTPEPHALAALFLLGVRPSGPVQHETVSGAESFNAVLAHTRNLRVLQGLRMQVPHFRLVTSVSSRVPITRMTRPLDRDSLAELVDRVVPALS
jgi:energy-coupling factor transporter ATP-binding protein EcfA2